MKKKTYLPRRCQSHCLGQPFWSIQLLLPLIVVHVRSCRPVIVHHVVMRPVVVDVRRWVSSCLHKHGKHGKHDQIIC